MALLFCMAVAGAREQKYDCTEIFAHGFRHVMMAGGCIWAKQDSDLANRVLKGLRAIRQAKGSYPITFVILSRTDAATRYQGVTGSTAAGAVKFDYKCHHDEMSEPGLVWPPGLQA